MLGGLIEGRKVVGIKQSKKVVESGEAQSAYVARDADEHIIIPFIDLCKQNNVSVFYIDTMKELAKMCKVDVATSVAVVLDKNT